MLMIRTLSFQVLREELVEILLALFFLRMASFVSCMCLILHHLLNSDQVLAHSSSIQEALHTFVSNPLNYPAS